VTKVRHSAGFEKDWVWRLGDVLVGGLCGAVFRVRFGGLENLPAEGAVILAPNHVSVLDPVAIALGVSRRGRVVQFLAAAEAFEHPVWGRGLRLMKQIPIRRGTRDLAALDELVDVLRDGRIAGIFPEGGIRDGRPPLKGHSGLVRIAVATGVPVVPVGVWGTQERWPPGPPKLRPFRRTPLAISVGQPIRMTGPENGGPPLKEETRRIMAAIEVQLGAAKRLAAWAALRPGA